MRAAALIETRRGEPRGPRIVVPDNPWSGLYRRPMIRAAVASILDGLGDRVAWRAYCDAGLDTPEPLEALRVAKAAFGPALNLPRRKAAPKAPQ